MKKTKFPNIYRKGKNILTLNLDKGKKVYGEELVQENGKEYRVWNPKRSKLGAAIQKGINNIFLKPGQKVLYLGAASGTTASHVSDIVGKNGYVFCLDISARVLRDLVFVAETRKNMFPILANAINPETYENLVPECDIIYQDIASPQQTEILIKNAEKFLKREGHVLYAVKSRSIDVTANPKNIFKKVEQDLRKKFRVIHKKRLEPFEKDHMFFVLKQ